MHACSYTNTPFRYVAHQMKKAINMVGAKKVLLVVIDGGSDWTSTEEMIQEFFPWISFLHCVSHEVSLILKDCFKPDGGIQELVELNEWITDTQHWFSTHACASMRKNLALAGEKTAFVWPACTRYCGVLLKIQRFHNMKALLRRVVDSGVYTEKNFVDDPFPEKINGAEVWELMERVIKTMGPLLLLCRLADGQKPVISKLHGTQLYARKEMEDSATRGGVDSIEEKICDVFLARWSEMQSPIVSATYMLDPLFVDQSKQSATCTVELWKLARRVLHVTDDAEWTTLHGKMVEQLGKFQNRGAGLAHMSSESAWTSLHTKCALAWWSSWGVEVPELQRLAIKLVPLMIGSGPAERTWNDVGNVLTKNRNRLGVQRCIDLVYVRMWMRRDLKLVSTEELEQFKEWEKQLIREASFYDGPVDPDAGAEREFRIFEDTFEDWEQDAIDGSRLLEGGPNIRLGLVRADKAARFRLQEKYKGLYFVDKDPNGEAGYYEGEGDALPTATAQWENRKIMGLCWENHRGWRAETKPGNALTGPSANYHFNPVLVRMIKDSTRNRSIRLRSEM